MSKPTRTTYAELQKAYDHFNRSLFKNELPLCLITLQRERSTYGYFSGDRWRNNDGETSSKCGVNAWAKRGVKLVCGVCEEKLRVSKT